MTFLIDTNVLLRFFELSDPSNPEIVAALDSLRKSGVPCHVCAQVLIESWVVATRPLDVNGLGFDLEKADGHMDEIEILFPCLPEPEDMAARWRTVVQSYSVLGKKAHDARIVAFMMAHGITHLVTLNPSDFARYPEITAITPSEIVATTA